MSIRSNIEAIMAQISGGDNQLGDDVGKDAVDAVNGGPNSPAWEKYMNRFSQSDTQLDRLLARDDTSLNPDMNLARSNLVQNGTCGATTTGFSLLDGVGDTLDENLE